MQTATTTVQTSGNITAESTAFSFDEESFGTLMTLLSNMYSNKTEAVLREYSANAYDSHVAAGQTRPIEVTLPTALQPTLLIQDFGLGLSKEDVERVYIRYGKSTKRSTNEQIGGFGIGCKAAFTLGHQFVVTAVKDGVKVVYLFALNEENIGSATLISEGPTSEPNGVLVSMAVEDVEEMRREARVFFSKWEHGTVLVDGTEPETIFERAIKVTDSAYVVPDFDGSVFLRMGQIAYPVSNSILGKVANRLNDKGLNEAASTVNDLKGWYNTSALFLNAQIGSAEIAPSREALMDSEQTVSALVDLLESLGQSLGQAIQNKVNEAPNAVAAALALDEGIESIKPLRIDRTKIRYNRLPLPATVEVEMGALVLGTKSHRAVNKIVKRSESYRLTPEDMERVVVVKGLTSETRGAVQRFAKRFLENSEYDIILFGTEGDEWGCDAESWFSWGTEHGAASMTHDEYKDVVKSLRATTSRPANEPRYSLNVWSFDKDVEDRTPLSEIIEEGKDILVFHDHVSLSEMQQQVIKDNDYNWVVLMPTQSESALEKRIEADGSIEIVSRETFRKQVEEHAASLYDATSDEKAALGARAWLDAHEYAIRKYNEWVRTLGGVSAITNKDILSLLDDVEMAKLLAEDITDERVRSLNEAARVLTSKSEHVTPYEVTVRSFTSLFPMLGHVYAWDVQRSETLRDDALAYVNMVRK